jgi:hypothetical protein
MTELIGGELGSVSTIVGGGSLARIDSQKAHGGSFFV